MRVTCIGCAISLERWRWEWGARDTRAKLSVRAVFTRACDPSELKLLFRAQDRERGLRKGDGVPLNFSNVRARNSLPLSSLQQQNDYGEPRNMLIETKESVN